MCEQKFQKALILAFLGNHSHTRPHKVFPFLEHCEIISFTDIFFFVTEVKVLLEDNFNELSEGLDKILDGSGHILKDNLAQVTQAVAIDNLATIVSGLGNVKRHLKDIERETNKVQIKVDQLRDGLGETKVKLVTALNQCATNEACSTFMQEYDIDKDLAVASDFKNLPSELPNVGPLLKDIADLMNNDIERKVNVHATTILSI